MVTDAMVDHLPYVLARPLFETQRLDADSGLIAENLLATYSALLRFSALLAVSQFLLSETPELPSGGAAAAGKAVVALRQPTLQSWYTAARTLAKLYQGRAASGPFTPELNSCVDVLTRERAGGRPLHEAITSIRNDHFGHSEGASAESKEELRLALSPLVLRAVEIFRSPLEEVVLARRVDPEHMMELVGPGPHFSTRNIAAAGEQSALRQSDMVIKVGDRYFPLFPLLIAAPAEAGKTEPLFSFDGHRVLESHPSGLKGQTECIRYRNFRHQIYRAEEFQIYRSLLDRKNVSPQYNARNFDPWNVTGWALSETRLALNVLTGSQYMPEFYKQRPQVEDRLWTWLDSSALPALLVLAEAGMGKTSLFCHVASKLLAQPEEETDETVSGDDCVILLRGSDFRSDVDPLYQSLCRFMGIVSLPVDHPDGFRNFRHLLELWSKNQARDTNSGRRLIILLDAANEAASLKKTLESFSELAKDAHSANIAAGRIWVRLLISVRKSHFESLERKLSAGSAVPLIPNEELFSTFRDGEGSIKRYLELPRFTMAETKQVYETRAQTAPACPVAWDRLHASTRELLRHPLHLDLFHRTFSSIECGIAQLPISEQRLWNAWFQFALPEDRQHTVLLRTFLFHIANACLEAGAVVFTQAMANRLLDEWERRQSTGIKGIYAASELDLFERLEAIGCMHRTPDGGWEWRAQLLGEQICRRALETRKDAFADWLLMPPSSLLVGALALWIEEEWKRGRVQGLSIAFHSDSGRRSISRALVAVAPLGAANLIQSELTVFDQKLHLLLQDASAAPLHYATVLSQAVAPILFERTGARPVLLSILSAALPLHRQIVEREPSHLEHQLDLSSALEMRGDLEDTSIVGQNFEFHEEAFQIRLQMTEQAPENRIYWTGLAYSCDRYGASVIQVDSNAARRCFLEGLKVRKALADDYPDDRSAQLELTISYNALGELERDRDINAAKNYFLDGLAIRERLSRPDWDGPLS